MEDPKKATRISELETLKLQNINLRLSIVAKERDDLARELLLKYGSEGERLNISEDGAVLRAAIPLKAVADEGA